MKFDILLNRYIILILFSFVCNGISATEIKYSLETRYIDVPLDHYTPAVNPQTFKLRYLINANNHIKGGPVFVYIGTAGDISVYAQNTGFLFEIAPIFNALLVFVEHRYYGLSLPFGNGSFASSENLKYLTTTQALADFAYVVEDLKKNFFDNYITYDTEPFVVFGASYGGMMAAWLRIKYPYLVVGAVATSTPYFYLPGLTSCDLFYYKVTMIFERYGREQCVKTIKLGWDVIRNLMKTKLGMDFVSTTWKLCKKINSPDDVEMLLKWLSDVYVQLSLTNYHYPSDFHRPLPAYPVKVFCDKLTTSYFNDTKSLVEYFGKALEIYTNYTGQVPCNDIFYKNSDPNEISWDYQSCTEIIRPICSTDRDMFLTEPWDYEKFSKECVKKFGVKALRPDWVILEYGGKNFKYYSNIVFSNCMMDPLTSGGVFLNSSDSVWSFNISDAPHYLEFRSTDAADNNYILDARQVLIKTVKSWLNIIL